MNQTPAHTRDYLPTQQSSATFHVLISQLNPSLRALAHLDWHTHLRHMRMSHEGKTRILRLKNPIQTWIDALGEEFGQTKPTLRRCWLRRQADEEIDLDDEGGISQTRINWEMESNHAADSRGRTEWYSLTRVDIINSMSGYVLT